jgi:putative methyltransferase (TIGR04325 family)
MKTIIRELTPPILLKILTGNKRKNIWYGNYKNWEEAEKESNGYDSDLIVKKVKDALLSVKRGEAAFERDSVLFQEMEYSWPLLSALSLIALDNRGILEIVDFGGSLGSLYFQYQSLLKKFSHIKWNVVEQEKFVKIGKEYFETEELKFYYTIKEAKDESSGNVVLLSSVLPYIKDPYSILAKIIELNFDYLIIDRTPFIKGPNDRLTIQKVPPEIYSASYPCWFFSEESFLNFFKERFDMIFEFENMLDIANIECDYKGFFFKKRDEF